jgi:ketosteroid isomerase-like protein
MKRIVNIIILLAVIALNIPSLAQEAKSLDKMKIRIQKINDKIAEAAMKGDTEAGMSFYADDVFYMPNYNKMIRGVEAMRKIDSERQEASPDITHMKMNTLEVIKSGNNIIDIGTYSLSYKMPGSQETVNDYGKYVTIWEKVEKELKIKVEIWNTDKNPGAMGEDKPQEKDGGVEMETTGKKEQTGATITKSGKKPIDPDSDTNTEKKK